MEVFSHVTLLATALGALLYSGGVLVRSITWMGRYFSISEYILSFVLAAFATSLPELFVGVNSAIKKTPELSLGNLVGANVLDVSIVLGITILIAGSIFTKGSIHKKDVVLTLGSIMAPGILALDHALSRLDGTILIGIFVLYSIHLIKEAHITPQANNMMNEERSLKILLKHLAYFFLSILLLLASSHLAVKESVNIANAFGLPLLFIGMLIALGTTLPEMIFSIKSVTMRHSAMSIGNSMGSTVLNTSFILGLVATIHPISIPTRLPILLGIGLVAILVFLIEFLGWNRGKLTRPFGIFLIVCAVAFVMIQNSF